MLGKIEKRERRNNQPKHPKILKVKVYLKKRKDNILLLESEWEIKKVTNFLFVKKN